MNDINFSSLIKSANELYAFKTSLLHRMNVIHSAARGQLKEIAHSMILADLLNIEFIQFDFLNTFLPDSNVVNSGDGKYKVERENNYVDICLEKNTTTIIIENKVNGALEQPGQIYRYVSNALDNGAKDVFVLYLNAISREMPSDKSLNGVNGESVFKKISRKHLKVVSYAYDILPWLRELLNKCSEKLNDIESAIIQYIDYLQIKFDINNEIMDKISSQLGIVDSFSYDDKIQICKRHTEAISYYKNEINNFIHQIACSAISTCKDELENIFKNCEFVKHNDDDKTGWIIKYKDNIEIVFTTTNGDPWWGIRFNGFSQKTSVLQALKQEFSDTEINSSWDIFKYSKYSLITTDAKRIFEILQGFK